MNSEVLDYIEHYKKRLERLVAGIDAELIADFIGLLQTAHRERRRVFVVGNGGSSATASHMVNDFGAGLSRRGILSLDIRSLSDNVASVTALANDIGYDYCFAQQLSGVAQRGDILIAISCSGDSPSIVKALDVARENEMLIVGLTGFSGGKLKSCSDINFHVQTDNGEYGLVEDMHMIFDHVVYSALVHTN